MFIWTIPKYSGKCNLVNELHIKSRLEITIFPPRHTTPPLHHPSDLKLKHHHQLRDNLEVLLTNATLAACQTEDPSILSTL